VLGGGLPAYSCNSLPRSLFFAGALIAVLGALAIEIIGSAFEVAETSSAKRKAKRQGSPSWIGRL
jgi:hypothetical protein